MMPLPLPPVRRRGIWRLPHFSSPDIDSAHVTRGLLPPTHPKFVPNPPLGQQQLRMIGVRHLQVIAANQIRVAQICGTATGSLRAGRRGVGVGWGRCLYGRSYEDRIGPRGITMRGHTSTPGKGPATKAVTHREGKRGTNPRGRRRRRRAGGGGPSMSTSPLR